MQYRALEEKAISEYHGLIYLFANRFGIDASPDILRHHLDIIQTPSDIIQTPPDTPRDRRFYAIEGTGRKCKIRVWPMDLVLLHPETCSVLRHIPDTKQTPPDTTQTPPVIGALCNIGHWKIR